MVKVICYGGTKNGEELITIPGHKLYFVYIEHSNTLELYRVNEDGKAIFERIVNEDELEEE